MIRPLLSLTSVLLALALAPAAARAEERAMTLDEVIDVALKANPDMASAKEDVTAALAQQKAMRGNFGPKLHIDANVMRFDSALQFDLTSLGIPAGLIPGPVPNIRDSLTTQVSLTLAQPIFSLWSIYEGYKVKELGVDVAKVRRETTRRNTAYQATESFYRVLQTMRLADVAKMSVESLEAQVARARSFFKHGLVNRNDLLRAELGLAAAKQRLIQAKGNVTLAQGRLALTMGVEPDLLVVPQGAPQEAPPPETMPIGEAEQRAAATRVEVKEIEAVIKMSNRGVRAAWSKMVPSVNLVGNYQHNTGSMFMQKNAAFVGLMISWDFWEWGATYYGIPEAQANERKAILARAKVRDGLRLDARSAWITQATAAEALAVAKEAVGSAEENFRLETKRYEAHANTSFDVIDAESQLTQSRATMMTALYDYIIARANLTRAVGDDLVGAPRAARKEGADGKPTAAKDAKDVKDVSSKAVKDAAPEGSHAER